MLFLCLQGHMVQFKNILLYCFRFGRYSSEIFRACRLVVDTGIHAFGYDSPSQGIWSSEICHFHMRLFWLRKAASSADNLNCLWGLFRRMSRDEAIEYIADHTAIPRSQIEKEVDRYITWPGQACAYKMGEREILRLRELAQNRLGNMACAVNPAQFQLYEMSFPNLIFFVCNTQQHGEVGLRHPWERCWTLMGKPPSENALLFKATNILKSFFWFRVFGIFKRRIPKFWGRAFHNKPQVLSELPRSKTINDNCMGIAFGIRLEWPSQEKSSLSLSTPEKKFSDWSSADKCRISHEVDSCVGTWLVNKKASRVTRLTSVCRMNTISDNLTQFFDSGK